MCYNQLQQLLCMYESAMFSIISGERHGRTSHGQKEKKVDRNTSDCVVGCLDTNVELYYNNYRIGLNSWGG